jgi:uncharacterized protein YeaO (DUF488 family)
VPIKVGCTSDYNKDHPDRIRKGRDNETVVLIASRRFSWVDCDEHNIELAPREPTLDEWKMSKMTPIDWKKFTRKYAIEMKSIKSQKVIRDLWERSKNGEKIRLICYEKDDSPFCHRYMLKLLIDEFMQWGKSLDKNP